MDPIKMHRRPGVGHEALAVGEWDYFSVEGEPCAGIIVRVPTGGWSHLPFLGQGRGIGRGAEWARTGDDETITLNPSVLHAAGTAHEWHGYVRGGYLVTC